MSLKIVHFSKTPLAGAPIRLVQALRQHTDHKVNLIDLERWSIFEHDVIYSENPEYALSLAENADIIHLHDCLDEESKIFELIDFKKLRQQGKMLLRQFHSPRLAIARKLGITESELLASSIPSIVIAQYPERYFPHSRVVPNIIPHNSDLYLPQISNSTPAICYSPTKPFSAWDGCQDYAKRWATKGTPETVKIIEQVANETNCQVKLLTGKTQAEVMKAKQQATIVADELVTGSYHLSGLEGLSVGKPVVAYLDPRTIYILKEISGSNTCPFVNVRLENVRKILVHLLHNLDEVQHLGIASRQWIEKYWSDKLLVEHFTDVYEQLILDPSQIIRQDSLRIDDKVTYFHTVTLPDLIYSSRADCFKVKPSYIQRVKQKLKFYLNKARQWCVKYFPSLLVKFIRKTFHVKRHLFNKPAILKIIRSQS